MAEPDQRVLVPGKVGLAALASILRWQDTAPVRLDRSARTEVEAGARAVAGVIASGRPTYGINTGFGKNANVSIAPAETEQLQRNLILSHASGVGPPIPADVVRLMMVLKLISLGRGASGVRWSTIELIEDMLAHDILPVVPAQGSVGASGDLAPLAHLALAMIGEGKVDTPAGRQPAAAALQAAGLAPVVLAAKEGLGMINGTQFSCAFALQGLLTAHRLAQSALVTGALATDALMGSTTPFHPRIHELRGHQGQIDAAATLRTLLDGSAIRAWHVDDDSRIQDPYSFRCQPQVMGACLDLLRQAAATLVIEANAVTDNPLVLTATNEFPSGGNFHAEPIAFAADQIALVMAEIGNLVQRRVALLVDTNFSNGLPSFLAGGKAGLNSGFMVPEIAAAALAAENKQRAVPCSIDSIPTSANQEDHVSMAAHGARRLHDMGETLARLVAIEWVVAGQGVTLRKAGCGWKLTTRPGKDSEPEAVRLPLPAGLSSSPPVERALTCLRTIVPPLEDDRPLGGEIMAAAELIKSGTLIDAVGAELVPGLSGPTS